MVVGPMTEQDAPSFGARLRLTREQSGLTLRQIADATKLGVRVLDALEHDRIKQLPNGIYRRAIVRAYATEVGLDPEKTLRAFLSTHPDDLPPLPAHAQHTVVVATAPPPSPAHWRTALSVVGALIPILAGVLYFTLTARGDDSPRHVADYMPPRAQTPVEAEIVPAGFSQTRPSARSVSMMISVSSRTALQVVADGREVLARQVDAGEVVRLHLDQDVVLVGDNAGAVHFSINGQAGRALGDDGSPLSVRIPRDDYQTFLIQP